MPDRQELRPSAAAMPRVAPGRMAWPHHEDSSIDAKLKSYLGYPGLSPIDLITGARLADVASTTRSNLSGLESLSGSRP